MADVQSLLREEVEAVVYATWPEVTVILMGQQAQRRAYQGIPLPYAVMSLGATSEGDWGLVNVAQERWIDFHYLHPWQDQAEDVIRARIRELRVALLAARFPLSQATLLELEEDTSPESTLNLVLISKPLEMLGGTLRARFTAGETALV